MMTEQELIDARNEIAIAENKITELKRVISAASNKIIQHNLETTAKDKYPDIQHGDLVDVTYKYHFWDSREKQQKTERLYFNQVKLSMYGKATDPGSVKFHFFQVKKDGTASKRETDFYADSIIKIEKVSE